MKSLLSIFQNEEDEIIKEQVREIYSRVNSETPTDFRDLDKKHEFEFLPVCKDAGASGHFYELENNLGGKVLYGVDKYGYHALISQATAFEKLRKEYINYKIGLELGISLPKKLDIVLAKEKKMRYDIPVLVCENVGKIEVGNINMKLSEIELSKNKFKIEAKKLMPYLWNMGAIDFNNLGKNMNYYQTRDNRINGADVCHVNSRWKSESKEAILIDTGKWKFKGLTY